MEQGVPNSAINLTAVPVDVPPALVKVRIPMSGDMLNDAYQYQRKNREAEMVDKAISEEEEIVRSDRHTERIKEILRTTALGQVPAGFTLADDLSEVPRGYKVPCKFQGLTNKLIHGPTRFLNEAEGAHLGDSIDLVGRLFNLHPDER